MKKKSGFGAFDLFALGFGAIIGVGWSITLHRLMINGGGPIPTALGYVISMVVFIPIALCFAELTSAIPVAGGVVAYAEMAYGRKMAFTAGWFLAMSYIEILPWEAIAINEIVACIFPVVRTGPILYTIAGSDIYLYSVIVGIALAFIIILINYRGSASTAKFQSILTVFLIITSILSIIVTLTKANAQNLLPAYAPQEGKAHTNFLAGMIAVFALTPQYYAGFDTIPQAAEEAGGVDKKKIGKIVVLVMACAGLFYGVIILSTGLAAPWLHFITLDVPSLSTLMKELYPGFLGQAMFWVTLLGALAGLFTTWNSFYVAGSRLLMSLGRIKLIPAAFAKVEEKHGTPYVANAFCAVMMMVGPFLGMGIIDLLSIIGSFGFIVGWCIACMCLIRLRKTQPELERPYYLKAGKLIAGLGVFFCVVMMLNCILPFMPGFMTTAGLIAVGTWIVIGIIFFAATDRKFRQEKKAA